MLRDPRPVENSGRHGGVSGDEGGLIIDSTSDANRQAPSTQAMSPAPAIPSAADWEAAAVAADTARQAGGNADTHWTDELPAIDDPTIVGANDPLGGIGPFDIDDVADGDIRVFHKDNMHQGTPEFRPRAEAAARTRNSWHVEDALGRALFIETNLKGVTTVKLQRRPRIDTCLRLRRPAVCYARGCKHSS